MPQNTPPKKKQPFKKVLIVTPHFPPANTADMQRVRQSLPYYEQFGWQPTVLAVSYEYTEAPRDTQLESALPAGIRIVRTKALPAKVSRKVGLGNLGLRALWHTRLAGNDLLRKERFDLVFFSTTMFAVMALGRYWRRRFGVPYIVDMQDPWRSDHYLKLPPAERPPKFRIAYTIDKYLEAYTMQKVDGVMAVSQGYCDTLAERYRNVVASKCEVITFGADFADLNLCTSDTRNAFFAAAGQAINIVYVGRGGGDLGKAASAFFAAIARLQQTQPTLAGRVKMFFIGTSYARAGMGAKTFEPLAARAGIAHKVSEHTDRQAYATTLRLLADADLLFVPGSEEADYTASKIFPYIVAQKPLYCVFHKRSSVVQIMAETRAGTCCTFDAQTTHAELTETIHTDLQQLLPALPFVPALDTVAFDKYTAKALTKRQVDFFDRICGEHTNQYAIHVSD